MRSNGELTAHIRTLGRGADLLGASRVVSVRVRRLSRASSSRRPLKRRAVVAVWYATGRQSSVILSEATTKQTRNAKCENDTTRRAAMWCDVCAVQVHSVRNAAAARHSL